MKFSLLISACLLFHVLVNRCLLVFVFVSSKRTLPSDSPRASLPPRGWNSFDSFCWTISEQDFLESAQIISQRLKPFGYEYAVVDYLWYRKNVPGAYVDSLGFDVIDKWGRTYPDFGRWPSAKQGKGFSEVADKVHSMGLKFGIHVMRGISTQAFHANTPILDTRTGRAYEESGRVWYAKDIAIPTRACAWMTHGFMSVNTNLGAGRAFLRSLYEQYASWGVDFVKHDCVFGDDLDINEIRYVSEVLKGLDRSILYSLSPGTSVTPEMAKAVIGLVNMYRITGDDWDSWGDVQSHFDVSRDFSAANLIGAQGLLGRSWPDMDMLPLGWLTDPGSNVGPHRSCRLNLDEQRTQMTLWSMARSPLMFGGDVRKLDESTYDLITNPTLLEINYYSSNNKEFPYVTSTSRKSTHQKLIKQSTRHHGNSRTLNTLALGLSVCSNPKAIGWSAESLEQDGKQICWAGQSEKAYQTPFCLHRREPRLASDEEINYGEENHGQHHLLAAGSMDFCLDASSNRRLTSKELKRGSFSSCRWNANQMWKLNTNGTMVNSYSGLCATIDTNEAQANAGGIRSWVATGRKGEIYVAFFNLNSEKIVMSAKISDVSRMLPHANLQGKCKGFEVWTGKEFQVTRGTLSTTVQVHGCALFVIQCY